MNEVKILLYDLEISPRLIWAYDMWEANALKIERPTHIMSLSWHWLGEEMKGKPCIYNMSQISKENSGGFSLDSTYDKELVYKLHSLLDEANIVIAHNAQKFDNRVANTMFMKHDLTPPSPYITIDTLQIARSKFKFPRNSLNELAKFLNVGEKSHVTHSELWYDCIMNKLEKSWKLLSLYNNKDVELLLGVYLKLRPYMNNHPNLANLSQKPACCPKCQGTRLENKGWRYTSTGRYKRYKCKTCGGWSSDRLTNSNESTKPQYISI